KRFVGIVVTGKAKFLVKNYLGVGSRCFQNPDPASALHRVRFILVHSCEHYWFLSGRRISRSVNLFYYERPVGEVNEPGAGVENFAVVVALVVYEYLAEPRQIVARNWIIENLVSCGLPGPVVVGDEVARSALGAGDRKSDV